MFEQLSEKDIELFLWEKGTTIHQKTHQKRLEILKTIYIYRTEIEDKYKCHFVGYVMHSYFFNMSVNERSYVIKLLIDDSTYERWCDKIEMLGILYKTCPRCLRIGVCNYIIGGLQNKTMTYIDIIAFCNCIRYIFDEVSMQQQHILFNILLKISHLWKHSPAESTLAYTLKNVRKILK